MGYMGYKWDMNMGDTNGHYMEYTMMGYYDMNMGYTNGNMGSYGIIWI